MQEFQSATVVAEFKRNADSIFKRRMVSVRDCRDVLNKMMTQSYLQASVRDHVVAEFQTNALALEGELEFQSATVVAELARPEHLPFTRL